MFRGFLAPGRPEDGRPLVHEQTFDAPLYPQWFASGGRARSRAAEQPFAEDFEVVPYPRLPLEALYSRRNPFRFITSRFTRDFAGLGFFIILTSWVVIFVGFANTTFVQISTVLVSSFLAAAGAIYQLSKRRFSTVDIFSSEILARLRTWGADSTVSEIIKFSDEEHVEAHLRRIAASRGDAYTVLQPSLENYFELFHRRSDDLGGLGSVVVDHATDFYCFHMAIRDQMRELKSTIESFPDMTGDIRGQVVDVIYMIDLCAFAGMRALAALIESDIHQLHSQQVAMSVGTPANLFLLEHMNKANHRYSEVSYRNAEYARLAKDLRKAIKQHKGAIGILPQGARYF